MRFGLKGGYRGKKQLIPRDLKLLHSQRRKVIFSKRQGRTWVWVKKRGGVQSPCCGDGASPQVEGQACRKE